MEKLLGVVMCGGESRRMGSDKGQIKSGDVAWARLAYDKLVGLGLPVVVSINQSQKTAYQHLFNSTDLITDHLDMKGPLNGIMSTHAVHPKFDLIILACDMTLISTSTLQLLLNIRKTKPGRSYYAFYMEGFFEPLCAIYTGAALAKISHAYAKNQLTDFSLQHILNSGDAKKIAVTEPAVFHNCNYPHDVSL